MEHFDEQPVPRCDEGTLAVALLALGYAAILVPKLAWALVGLLLMLFGALVTLATWQRAALHHRAPSSATRLAVWMLKVSAVWMLLGRALVGWLSE